MTVIRPAPNRFVNYLAWANKDAPDAVTLNTHFKTHGYTCISLGKVFHHATDNVHGWSEKPWRPKTGDYHNRALQDRAMTEHREKYPEGKKPRGMPYEAFDAPDETYRDAENASKAISHMERFAKEKHSPFFLAVVEPFRILTGGRPQGLLEAHCRVYSPLSGFPCRVFGGSSQIVFGNPGVEHLLGLCGTAAAVAPNTNIGVQ